MDFYRQKIGVSIIFFLFNVVTLFAQPGVESKMYQEKYRGESHVYQLKRENLDITLNKKGEFRIFMETERKEIYLTPSASRFAQRSIQTSEFFEIIDIAAYTLVPDGNKYKKSDVKVFTEKDELDQSVFYNGVKSKNFFYPSLTEGAKTYLYYKTKLTEPRFLTPFFMGSTIPIEKIEYVVSCDVKINLEFSFVNINKSDISIQEEENNKQKKYSFTLHDVDKYSDEIGSPSHRYYIPHIIVRIKDYERDGKKNKILDSIADLHKWYNYLIKSLNKTYSGKLATVVDSLTKDVNVDIEKVKKIYYWVQNNIKYIAFEKGLSGFIPAEASVVYESRYGDCKGMSSITHEMLRIANIKSYLTWIGSRAIPYSFDELPTPLVDNHMIVTYKDNGKYYFLDATGSSQSIDLPTAFIQGKQALVSIDSNNFELVTVPILPYNRNTYIDTAYIEIEENGTIVGKGQTIYRGFLKTSMRGILKTKSRKEQLKFINAYYEKGNNKFHVDSFEIYDLNDKDEPMKIYYEFDLKNYAKVYNDEIYINMNLEKIYTDKTFDKDRQLPFEIRYKSRNNIFIILPIPKEYELTHLPENSSFDNENFGFSIDYKKLNNSIVYHFENYDNFLLLEKQYFNEWNNMVKELKNNFNEVVIFKKKN